MSHSEEKEMNIRKKAVLTTLNVSAWTARKYDRKVSENIEEQYRATEAGRYNKLLISKDFLKNIEKITSSARSYQYKVTLPWTDGGYRLLHKRVYFDYMAEMAKYQDQFNSEVRIFLDNYSANIDEARERLADMFNFDDYPTIDNLKTRFNFTVTITPIPSQFDTDLRVGFSDETMEEIEENIKDRLEESTRHAVRNLGERLYKVVEAIVKRLSNVDAVFRNSLVENVRELCDLFPILNITEDPEMDELFREVKDKLTVFEPEELRANANTRYKVASEAQSILDKMKGYRPEAQ